MKSRVMLIMGLAISLLISVGFATIYKYDNEIVKNINMASVRTNVPEAYKSWIDSAEIKDGALEIKGWVFKKGENLEYLNRKVVLVDNKNNVYEVNTLMERRTEITSVFNDGFNYDNAGMIARCPIKQFKDGDTFKIGYIVTEQNGDSYYIPVDKSVTIEKGE
ncbi:hypothetical protein [Clostridium saccharoperbutylacetonicum]|uniref:hypothetical protein n=1 Tax=Clostridium saccharoperbutylacetonicum TaxID=36745 RepID=UPI0009840142|nr:hypothetical protein [Clostridium saccharoperbutylacetonicum]AQR97834.1 hypothetical protein CLSAP_51670 [Clostridium saccharoperbutylacetonicum]NSB33726.1 hypothetical protein [Clostridium saccharoperbutylacetonicum]